MTRLRNAPAEVRLLGQLVPFDDGDLGELAGERLGDEEAGHTAAYHGGAVIGHA